MNVLFQPSTYIFYKKNTEMQPSVVKQADTHNFDTEQYVGV